MDTVWLKYVFYNIVNSCKILFSYWGLDNGFFKDSTFYGFIEIYGYASAVFFLF